LSIRAARYCMAMATDSAAAGTPTPTCVGARLRTCSRQLGVARMAFPISRRRQSPTATCRTLSPFLRNGASVAAHHAAEWDRGTRPSTHSVTRRWSAATRAAPLPGRRMASSRRAGRRPEGPAADVRLNRFMQSGRISSQGADSCAAKDATGGIRLSSSGAPGGCRSRRVCRTPGSAGFWMPSETRSWTARAGAPSDTRARTRRTVRSSTRSGTFRARFADRVSMIERRCCKSRVS